MIVQIHSYRSLIFKMAESASAGVDAVVDDSNRSFEAMATSESEEIALARASADRPNSPFFALPFELANVSATQLAAVSYTASMWTKRCAKDHEYTVFRTNK